jgi:hypothetical protein
MGLRGSRFSNIQTDRKDNSKVNIKEQIEKARDRLRVKGDTLKERIKEIEDNPGLLDIKHDIVTIAACIGLLKEDLDLKENSGKDKLIVLKQLSDMLKVSSDLKEKAFKIKTGHFDLEAMKTVVVQIVSSLRFMRGELENTPEQKITKQNIMNLVDRTILNIETVKVPMITSK